MKQTLETLLQISLRKKGNRLRQRVERMKTFKVARKQWYHPPNGEKEKGKLYIRQEQKNYIHHPD